MSRQTPEVYAFRAAMRFAWNHPPLNSITILRCEFRERHLTLGKPFIVAFQAANAPGFKWNDPCATSRPLDNHGQPIWRESRLDTLRRAAWIAAAEALLPKESSQTSEGVV